MPAKDKYHDAVRHALEKDSWKITDDPFSLKIGERDAFIDIGAEKLFTAEKEGRKIAVEVKSFIGNSAISDLQNALGQFIFYQDFLMDIEPERILFLAVRQKVFINLFQEPVGQKFLENKRLKLLVFDEVNEEIIEWIN
jgi:XisH protein